MLWSKLNMRTLAFKHIIKDLSDPDFVAIRATSAKPRAAPAQGEARGRRGRPGGRTCLSLVRLMNIAID